MEINYQLDVQPSLQIIAIGYSGSGKSTLLNSLSLGSHQDNQLLFQESQGFASKTTSLSNFIDTPGLSGIEENDKEVITKISNGLNQLSQGVTIALLCFSAETQNIPKNFSQNMTQLGEVLKRRNIEIVKVCFTKMDRLSQQESYNIFQILVQQIFTTVQQSLGVEVSQKIIFYKHKLEDDGLEDLLKEIEGYQKQNQANSSANTSTQQMPLQSNMHEQNQNQTVMLQQSYNTSQQEESKEHLDLKVQMKQLFDDQNKLTADYVKEIQQLPLTSTLEQFQLRVEKYQQENQQIKMQQVRLIEKIQNEDSQQLEDMFQEYKSIQEQEVQLYKQLEEQIKQFSQPQYTNNGDYEYE